MWMNIAILNIFSLSYNFFQLHITRRFLEIDEAKFIARYDAVKFLENY